MIKYCGFFLILFVFSSAGNGAPSYCDSLLKAEDIIQVCKTKNLKVNPYNMKGTSDCDLSFKATDNGNKSLHFFHFQSPSPDAYLDTQKNDTAVAIPGIGDQAFLMNSVILSVRKDTIIIAKGRNYLEFGTGDRLCSVENLQKLSQRVISRLPK